MNQSPQSFPPTRWSLVSAATQQLSPESAAALDAICRAYWYPLYAYVRRCGKSPADAEDLTQEFFRHLLEKRWLADADREKGRLRTFLIVALKHFMAKEWRRESAQRCGGGQVHVPMDTAFAENRLATDPSSRDAEAMFDRQWALTLLERTLERLRVEFANLNREKDFDSLKGSLMAARGAIDYELVAAQLGTSSSTARVMVHRLRKRFRDVYREEISQTLSENTNLDEEIRHLADVLARG